MKRKYSYAKLRGKIVEKFGTQDKFAEHLEISRQALSNKMTGKTGLSQEDIENWCEALDISFSEIGAYFFT